jgi:hypothetical protein
MNHRTIDTLGPDMFLYICGYLEIYEFLRFASSSKGFLDVVDRDSHWKSLAESRINGFKSLSEINRNVGLCELFGVSTFRSLFIGMWPFGSTLLGCFGKHAPITYGYNGIPSYYAGGYLNIYEENGMVMCEFGGKSSFDRIDGCLFFDNGKARIRGLLEDHFVHAVRTDPTAGIWTSFGRYERLPLSDSSSTNVYVTSTFGGKGCQRLYQGVYGPHGQEIVSTRLVSSEGATTSQLELQALKVTGDKNVPAGQVSFTVALREGVSISDVLSGMFCQACTGGVYDHSESFAQIIMIFGYVISDFIDRRTVVHVENSNGELALPKLVVLRSRLPHIAGAWNGI